MKSPFPYYGGKSRVAEQIADLLPKHTHYVEPFAGALSILLAKAPSPMETANDANGHIVNFFEVLRDRREELEAACVLSPHSRAEHASARDLLVDDPVERARRTFVLLSQGRNASLRKTGWAHFQNPGSQPGRSSRPSYLANLIGRFAPIADRLLNVSFENRDGLDLISEYGRHAGVLLYVDPPYLSATRSSLGYEIEFGRAEQHEDLLDRLLACKSQVVLSGYESDLYATRLADWDRHTLTGSRDARGARREEVIWSNSDLGSYLDFEAMHTASEVLV